MERKAQYLGGGRNLMAFETVGSWFDPVKCLVLFLLIRFEFIPINEHPFISFVCVCGSMKGYCHIYTKLL